MLAVTAAERQSMTLHQIEAMRWVCGDRATWNGRLFYFTEGFFDALTERLYTVDHLRGLFKEFIPREGGGLEEGDWTALDAE